MDFNYQTVYRTEGLDPEYSKLTGAARFPLATAGEDAWIFWNHTDDFKQSVTVITFSARSKAEGDVVVGDVANGPKGVKFIPVVIADIQASPEKWNADPELVKTAVQADVNLNWHQAEVSEVYADWVAPLEQHIAQEDLDRLGMSKSELVTSTLIEARGIPAEIGAIHVWRDGHAYQKKDHYLWRRVPSSWTDDDPDDEIPRSTSMAYRSPDGMWEPARKKLHHEIIAKYFEGIQPVPEGEQPTAALVMGLPAAGKSSFVEGHPDLGASAVLDPDRIVEALPEFQLARQKKVRGGARAVYEEAAAVNDLALAEAVKRRVNFTVPGTGADLKWVQDHFLKLADQGWKVRIFMPHIMDLDELMIRSEARGERSGRFVPTERLAELWQKLPHHFMELRKDPRVSELALIGSSNDGHRDIMDLSYVQFRENGTATEAVWDKEFWSEFQKHDVTESVDGGLKDYGLPSDHAKWLTNTIKLLKADLANVRAMPKQYTPGSGIVDDLPSYFGIPYEPQK